ncbi:MAG TPA: SgcJ/EcaC family oxidoreductase [Acidimicrobiales bacterium]|nr:SgcJ/EcaC family oxidoreductase [Acidimicrobiales bacterium]
MTVEAEVEVLYRRLLQSWNERDAERYGQLFADDGSMVGFDGTCVESAGSITDHLRAIFADHRPATYVAIVREVRQLGSGVTLLRAVVGMIPPGGSDLDPDANAVQALVAVETGDGWRIAHFHNTPAAFHGRPEEVRALTAELRLVRDRLTP